jgi:hypothetical protein
LLAALAMVRHAFAVALLLVSAPGCLEWHRMIVEIKDPALVTGARRPADQGTDTPGPDVLVRDGGTLRVDGVEVMRDRVIEGAPVSQTSDDDGTRGVPGQIATDGRWSQPVCLKYGGRGATRCNDSRFVLTTPLSNVRSVRLHEELANHGIGNIIAGLFLVGFGAFVAGLDVDYASTPQASGGSVRGAAMAAGGLAAVGVVEILYALTHHSDRAVYP